MIYNKKMKSELIEMIKNSIKEGYFLKAKKETHNLLKLKPHSWSEIIQISEFQLWLGQSKAALKILGEPKSESELKVISTDELCVQIRLAYMLAYLGVKNMAGRQFNSIEKILKSRDISIQNLFPKYFQYLGHYYLSVKEYQLAYNAFNRTGEIYSHASDIYKYAQIGKADSLDGLGKTERALSLLSEFIKTYKHKEDTFLAICYQVQGEYLFRSERLDEAKKSFDISLKLFSSEISTKDKAYLFQFLGAYYLIRRAYSKAKDLLLEALEILLKKNSQPIASMGVIYWLEQIPHYQTELGLKIALRCHFDFSLYSLLVGREIKKEIVIHPWFQKRVVSHGKDSWLIQTDTIDPIKYNIMKNEKDEKKSLLDLFSGLHFYNMNFTILSHIQSYCLALIIGSGDLGITVWSLVDQIYGQDFYSLENGVLRIENLIQRLVKHFPIYRDKGYFFYKRNKNEKIILSMDLLPRGPHAYFRKFKDHFKRIDIEKFFLISSSTANRWITDWINMGLLKQEGLQKEIYYIWIDSK